MKWSELPKEYQELEIPKEAKNSLGHDFNNDDLIHKFHWRHTNQGQDFWNKCEEAKTIDELPPLPEKEFILPEKWCVRGYKNDCVHNWFNKKLKREIATSVINYFHYPEIEANVCTSCAISNGYSEIAYDQWVKYVRDVEYRENALKQNNNLEKIKEMRDVVNDKDQEPIESFYMIYVDGASGSTRKHDYESACKEAHRLSKETDKKVFILRSVEYFERNIEIKNTILLK